MTINSSSRIIPRPIWQVLIAVAVAVVSSVFAGAIQQYGSVPLGHATLMTDLVVGAIGMMVILPGINVAIASIWEPNRNPRARRNIYFWWAIAVTIAQLLILANRLSSAG